MEIVLILLITIPLFTAFLIPLIDILYKKARKYLVVFSAFVEFSLSIYLFISNYNEIINGTLFIGYKLGGWIPPLGINLVMDMLSFYFSSLVTFAVMFLVIYSIGFIGHHEGKYYVLLYLLWSAMQGIILTGDVFNFYVFLELILITSAPLIAFKRNKEGTKAAIKYMFYGIVGGLFIFIGLIFIYSNLGTLNFAEISVYFNKLPLQTQKFIALFFLLGFFIKLGIFPFHFWVARAQSAAPSPVSALLSGIVEKIYIYSFLRMFWFVFGYNVLQELRIINPIIFIALLSSIIGHTLALQEDDIKRLLAYSTIGHLGIIIAVLVVNSKLAIIAGLLHVFAHMLMKISLFTTTGYILQFTPSHKLIDSRGVAYNNLVIFLGFIVAAGGMIGLPPMIGFFSKLFIVQSFIENGMLISGSMVILGSIIALIYYFRYIVYGFKKIALGSPEEFRLILSVLYRERVVTDIALFFVSTVIISGLFYKIIYIPIVGIAELVLNPNLYIEFILGG